MLIDSRLHEMIEADAASETEKVLAKKGRSGCGLYNAAKARNVLNKMVIRSRSGMKSSVRLVLSRVILNCQAAILASNIMANSVGSQISFRVVSGDSFRVQYFNQLHKKEYCLFELTAAFLIYCKSALRLSYNI